jgi:hypothetical protein
MSLKSRIVIAGLVALPFLAAAPALSFAQTAQSGGPYVRATRPARPQIEITPGRLLYRRCVGWLELQHRPSGTVLYPQKRCWWVRG